MSSWCCKLVALVNRFLQWHRYNKLGFSISGKVNTMKENNAGKEYKPMKLKQSFGKLNQGLYRKVQIAASFPLKSPFSKLWPPRNLLQLGK